MDKSLNNLHNEDLETMTTQVENKLKKQTNMMWLSLPVMGVSSVLFLTACILNLFPLLIGASVGLGCGLIDMLVSMACCCKSSNKLDDIEFEQAARKKLETDQTKEVKKEQNVDFVLTANAKTKKDKSSNVVKQVEDENNETVNL